MKKQIMLFVTTVICICSTAQTLTHEAVIWQGFTHRWTYNHRCNRIGDYVQWNNGKPTHTHCSATGIGPDSTYYSANYTKVNANDVWFTEGIASMVIKGKERELINGEKEITLPLTGELNEHKKYTVLLNGFDIHAETAADKLQLIQLAIHEPYIKNDSLHFTVSTSLVLNCQSLECPELKTKYVYGVDVYWLLAASDYGDIRIQSTELTNAYSWGEQEEIFNKPQTTSVYNDNEQLTHAVSGIQSFQIVLNQALWLLNLNTMLTPYSYNPITGEEKLYFDLFFKEWGKGMKNSSIAPNDAKFSERRKGWSKLDMDIATLFFKGGNTENISTTGTMFWRGNNARPNSDAAKSVIEID